ncbi:MAG: transporter [bacterium]
MTRRSELGLAFVGSVGLGLFAWSDAHASLARNAAGPKNMGEEGVWVVDTAGEVGTEPDGNAWNFETGAQYQVGSRLQILGEAIVFEQLNPDSGESSSGFGDLDLTLSWLASFGQGALPAVVPAFKVKLPTSSSDEGTGEVDYSALLILEKEYGELALNAETEYAWIGSPSDEPLNDQFIYTFTVEYGLSNLLAVYVEAFGNSAPTDLESRTDAALVGAEFDILDSDTMTPYLSVEYDTEEVGVARAGVEFVW